MADFQKKEEKFKETIEMYKNEVHVLNMEVEHYMSETVELKKSSSSNVETGKC